jgi:hypothetical protein
VALAFGGKNFDAAVHFVETVADRRCPRVDSRFERGRDERAAR